MEKFQLMNVARQHAEHAAEYEAAALEVLRSGTNINGEQIQGIEAEFAAYLGIAHAASCGNGTDALAIALQGLGIVPGDKRRGRS